MLSPEPLIKYAASQGNGTVSSAARVLGVERGTIYGWRLREWISPEIADQHAIRLGLHPVEIWGWAWVDNALEGEQ